MQVQSMTSGSAGDLLPGQGADHRVPEGSPVVSAAHGLVAGEQGTRDNTSNGMLHSRPETRHNDREADGVDSSALSWIQCKVFAICGAPWRTISVFVRS